MSSIFKIKSILSEHKQELFSKYPIYSMAIFGSYARNEQNRNSDLDLLVDVDSSIGIRFIDLANEIEELVNTKVDLVSKKGIKEGYYKSIVEDLIYV